MPSSGKHRSHVYKQAYEHVQRIEAELKALKAWDAEPPPPEAFESRKAFFADTMTFYQWLQWVLLERIMSIVVGRGEFPKSSSVGVYAVRALDGQWEAEKLISALYRLDGFIESVAEDEDDRDDEDEDEEDEDDGAADSDEDGDDEDEDSDEDEEPEEEEELEEEDRREQGRKPPAGPVWQLSEVATEFLDSLPSLVYPELREIEQDEYGWRAHGIVVVKTPRAAESQFHVFLRFTRTADGWVVDPDTTLELNTRTVHAYAAGLSRRIAEAFAKGDQAEAQRILQSVQDLSAQPPVTREMVTPETPAPVTPAASVPKMHIEPIRLGGTPTEEEATPEPAAPATPGRSYPPQPYDVPVQQTYPEAAAVTESYLRALAAGDAREFMSPNPFPASGRDLGMAEQVYYSVKGFVGCFGELDSADEGPVVSALVEANRGVWPVKVVFFKRLAAKVEPEEHLPSYFQPVKSKKKKQPKPEDLVTKLFVEPHLSLLRTQDYYLRQSHIHPPFAAEKTARQCAMQFWHYLKNNSKRFAVELLAAGQEDMDLPKVGEGWVDEIVFYISQTEEPAGVCVRVLANTQEYWRFWDTFVVYRDGKYKVDLAETIRRSQPGG